MHPAKKLNELITAYMSKPGEVLRQKPETNFVMTGLRTAIFSNSITRQRILSDVADVLGCHAQDLEFLYTAVGDGAQSGPKHDMWVPDYRTELLAVAE